MTKDAMIVLAKTIAVKYNLDPALVCAVCHHESNDWSTWAMRFEPGFYNVYVSKEKMPLVDRFGPTISETTERNARATSYGLMQVMGQVAREFGFNNEYLTELCDPNVGMDFGCLKLARCMKIHNNDQHQALLAYNGGGDQSYPDKVLSHYADYA